MSYSPRFNEAPVSFTDKNWLAQQTKRIIGKRDARLKENKDKADIVQETKKKATANGELSMSLPNTGIEKSHH